MNVLGLFSGIGGFELGFQRAGFRIAAMCEIEPYCRRVLRAHWPDVPVYDDVRTLTAERLRADGIKIDVITGGFPCQDISLAGRGAGITGSRSGLWFEYKRIIEEVRPSWVVAENVSALRSRGLDDVLRSLAEIGYDAEWHCIPACAIGAPHRRDRVWIVAYPARLQPGRQEQRPIGERAWQGGESVAAMADPEGAGTGMGSGEAQSEGWRSAEDRGAGIRPRDGRSPDLGAASGGQALADSVGQGLEGRSRLADGTEAGDASWWLVEPDVGRVANGVPARVDRLRSLGNAVVPQIPEIIAKAIADWDFWNG